MKKTYKIILVTSNASFKMGGEAARALKYFEHLHKAGVETYLVTHGRSQKELLERYRDKKQYLHFVKDNFLHKIIWKVSTYFPDRIKELVFGGFDSMLTDFRSRSILRGILQHQSDFIIHKVAPNSPLFPSFLKSKYYPIVFGPLDGAVDFPPNFIKNYDNCITRAVLKIFKLFGVCFEKTFSVKKYAAAILFANKRTYGHFSGFWRKPKKYILPQAVDRPVNSPTFNRRNESEVFVVCYVGRIVDLKGVDILVEAFKQSLCHHQNMVLKIIGDGPLKNQIEEQIKKEGIEGKVNIAGHLPLNEVLKKVGESHVFVLPSLKESQGMVLYEAMSQGVPVIATDWAGPSELPSDKVIKVKPLSREGMVNGISSSILRLVKDEDLRLELATTAFSHMSTSLFYWDNNIDFMISIYDDIFNPKIT